MLLLYFWACSNSFDSETVIMSLTFDFYIYFVHLPNFPTEMTVVIVLTKNWLSSVLITFEFCSLQQLTHSEQWFLEFSIDVSHATATTVTKKGPKVHFANTYNLTNSISHNTIMLICPEFLVICSILANELGMRNNDHLIKKNTALSNSFNNSGYYVNF